MFPTKEPMRRLNNESPMSYRNVNTPLLHSAMLHCDFYSVGSCEMSKRMGVSPVLLSRVVL